MRAFADIIRDGENGFLFEDEDGCARALKKCLDANDGLRAESVRTARGFDLNTSAEKTVALYEEIIKTKEGGE
jgi:glycosyltransferase involved in cell wall biosynthesis